MRRLMTQAVCVGALSCAAPAQSLHEADYSIRVEDGRIEIGVVTGPGTVEFPFLVKSAEFGDGGIADFTADPGWNSQLGGVPAGTEIGFDIVAAVREWNGFDFDTISDDTITVRKFLQNFVAPPTDTVVPGIVFGAGDSDGIFHHHVQFLLNQDSGPAGADGVWLLQLQLWSTSGSIERSDTNYIVFAQGAGVPEQGDAIAWVEANLIGGPCNAADLSEPEGVLDFGDVIAFLSAFGAGDPAADLGAPEGVFDFADVLVFLGAFGAGCP
jgi:hypothetical protein